MTEVCGAFYGKALLKIRPVPPTVISKIKAPEAILCLAETSDFLFAGLPSGSIRVWHTWDLQLQGDVFAHRGSVLSLLYNESKQWLISASSDSSVRIWHSRTLQPLWTIGSYSEGIGDVFSLACIGNRVIWGTQSCTILVKDSTLSLKQLFMKYYDNSGLICLTALPIRKILSLRHLLGATTSFSTRSRPWI